MSPHLNSDCASNCLAAVRRPIVSFVWRKQIPRGFDEMQDLVYRHTAHILLDIQHIHWIYCTSNKSTTGSSNPSVAFLAPFFYGKRI